MRDVQAQVRRWDAQPASEKRPMCTDRKTWMNLSTRFEPKDSWHRIRMSDLCDILSIDTEKGTVTVAQEGARVGITVNVIRPGYIATDMVKAMSQEVLQKNVLPQIPIGRLGEPEEVARCVVFLASDDAGLITGSTLTANGGQYFA